MAARRRLRLLLHRAVMMISLSAEARERLRERLRAEGGAERAARKMGIKSIFTRLFAQPLLLASASLAVLGLIISGAYGLRLLHLRAAAVAGLSPVLMAEAAGDHDHCAAHFINAQGPVKMSDSAKQYGPAYEDLDRVAEAGARNLQLRAAHICRFSGRRFAHLVYTRNGQLISLLVTERDERAMRRGVVPQGDGLRVGLEQVLHGRFTVSAYQTSRHVVLVVSELSEQENKELAERIALPVSVHLRRTEMHLPQLNPANSR
jgi:hypothetical protein